MDDPHSSFGCFGDPNTVRPMKSRSTLRIRPASSFPLELRAFLALEEDLKVTVATSKDLVAEL